MAAHVEDDLILDLRQGLAETGDQAWQLLFAENYVMMHTELAGAAPSIQPRYQLFQCVDPPVRDAGGQTLLLDQSRVVTSLSRDDRRILAATRNSAYSDSPPFLRRVGGRVVVAYKDTEAAGFAWACDLGAIGRKVTIDEVDAAIGRLIDALHDEHSMRGIWWRQNLVAVFDNTRWVHGRTYTPLPPDRVPRRLREVRVGNAA
jgi:alpha-ketoglutarate-dependent taurine dioxygenase